MIISIVALAIVGVKVIVWIICYVGFMWVIKTRVFVCAVCVKGVVSIKRITSIKFTKRVRG